LRTGVGPLAAGWPHRACDRGNNHPRGPSSESGEPIHILTRTGIEHSRSRAR